MMEKIDSPLDAQAEEKPKYPEAELGFALLLGVMMLGALAD